MFKGLICVAIIATSVLLFAVAKQVQHTKKQRVIPDQFKIEVGDVPRWLYRHAYNVSINGRLKTDRCRVPMELTFNRSMLPADLYEQVYLHTFIMPPVPKEKPLPIDPLNLTFDERRKIEMDEFFGTERPYAWVQRGWNWTCEVCQKEFPVESDYLLHEAMHYVTNYSATPIMNWTIIQMQDEQFRNESESYWIDYWHNVSKGLIDPEWDTDIVPTTWSYLENPIICYICNASIYNTSEYNSHIERHKAWEEEKYGNLTIKFSRPTKSFDEIQFRKVYVPDSLNTLEEVEYEEAQRIIKEASHSLNTDEIMERTQNLSINKRLLEFGVDSRGYTITWPRIKLMPDMEPQNDSQEIGHGPWTDFPDSALNRFQEERRRKWEEDYLRRRKAQEKGNPVFASYSLESNETAMERRALNITRRRRKYTPKLIYIRRKKRDVAAGLTIVKTTKKTTPYPQRLLGKKILRRVNSNKRKTKDQVYKQQLAKIIQRAKKYMSKYNKTHYPTTQSLYEKVQIYKIKEKFKRLNWFLWGLDNYTVPPEIDIDMITNTPHSTVRPLFYKRLEKRDLWMRQFYDYKRHKRHINEIKSLIDNVDKIHQKMIAEDGDERVGNLKRKRSVNFEDINLQEIENVLNPLPPGTLGENPLKAKQDILLKDATLDKQRSNYKKLLFKRDVERSKLLDNHIFENNLNVYNHFGKPEIKDLTETKQKLLKKRDLSHNGNAGNEITTSSIEFFNSSEIENKIKRTKREVRKVKLNERKNIQEDLEIISQTFNVLVKINKQHRKKRQVDKKNVHMCQFYKSLLDEKTAMDEEERQMIQLTKDAIKRSAENEAKNKTLVDVVKNEKESLADVQHFNMDQNHINQFNMIRNKRSPHNHVHDHDEDICEHMKLRREKREPRFRKDRLPTRKKKRTTCPYFARTKYMYNCTACRQVFSLEGELANHEWRKHNGSALIVSYDTKDIEDEYYSWDYEAIPANDTIETTREKWEKRCLVPNQKRHRFMNKGCTARYRPDQDGGGGGGDGEDGHNIKKRDIDAVETPKIFNHKRSIRGVQKRKMKRDDSNGRISNLHNIFKRDIRIQDSEGNPITKFAPEVEEIFKGKYENRGDRLKRNVQFEDLTDELHSNVRDPNQKYQWEWDKSWEWRIKNVNIRDYMYKIMEKRMSTKTPHPDAVVYDMFDVSNEAVKYKSDESKNRRVSQFYADNGYFSGRTGSDMEIYMDSNPHLPECKEVGPPNHDYGKDYLYKPKPDLFLKRHHPYTNVKPGSRTKLPKGHTTEANPEVDFTDKKDYYDSDIEVAKSQFRFRRDLNHEGQYSMERSEDSVPKTVHRKRRGITYDSDYSSNIQRFSVEDLAPEIFAKIYPNQAEYTPYTFYPTTLPWLTTDPNIDPAATYKWIEKSGPDSGDDDFEPTKTPLEESVQQFLESDLVSQELAKETIHPQDYQEWLDWQRNRSLEDDNSYHPRVWTCQFHPCTFNASIEAIVGDHIFVDHFTHPTNYKEAFDYHIETSTLGWDRLTNVDFLLHRYSDEALHPEIREDFDIFTGLFNAGSFPTVHPNFTDPSKPKRTRYVPPTDPMCETIGTTKAQPKFGHKAHTLCTKAHHRAHTLDHAKTSHAVHGKHHPTTPHHTGHKRKKRGLDSILLPPMPPDSNDRSGSKGSGSNQRRRRHKRAYHSVGPISGPNSQDDLSGYDGPAFLKTGESLGEITPKEEGTTVWDWSSWQSEYEPQNQTQWKFSEETVPPKYRCKYCGDLFHEENHLLTHRSSAHPRKKPRTTTPCIRMMKKYFTLDSEVDMSKNYDFVFSEPDNGSFVQDRPILEDSFYQSFDSKDPDNVVNSASYREMDEYIDWVFNKSKYSICNACGKNISDISAEAHFRKHVSNIKKDYFDELPPEYMDRCFKEAHWNESWETVHHKLKRQYEENRIVQSIFEPETYRCNRCNSTFKTHELTYAHLLEHKKNSSLLSAREAAIRTQLKRERAKYRSTLRKEQKNWNPEYINYLNKAGKHKRSVDCIEIEYPEQSNSNQSVPLYKIYESFNNSKERIENVTPEYLSNTLTVEMDKNRSHQTVIQKNESVTQIRDDYNERSISENLESQVQDRYQQTSDSQDNVTTNDEVSKKDQLKEETQEHIVEDIPDYYFNVNYKADDNDEQDNNSEESEDSYYDSNRNDYLSNGNKQTKKNLNSRVKKPTLEELIANVKQIYNLLKSKDILSSNSTLLRRIENILGNTGHHRKEFLRRLKRSQEGSPEAALGDRWNSTECNYVERLEKRFKTTLKDRGHKFLETDVSRLIEDLGVGQEPNLTSLENRQRVHSFRECMRIIDHHETRSEQNYHIYNDHHLDYMRLRTESPKLSPSEESLVRSRPRNEYSDYEELVSDRWKCFECNETFDNYTAFLMHMKKPKEGKWPLLIEMENEREKASLEKLFTTKSYWINECYECGKHFNTRKELIDHINDKGYESLPHVDKVEQSVKCIHCDIVYSNVQKYLEHRAHVKEAEDLLQNITDKEFCGDCKKYFDNHEDYLHHLNMERKVDYEEMPKYVCKICNFTYLDSISLGVHVKKIHPETEKEYKRKRRSCQIENRQKVKIISRHANYDAMRHIMLKSANVIQRKRRNVEYKKKMRKEKMKNRRKRELKALLKMKNRIEEHKKDVESCDCHANGHGIKKREINTMNKHHQINNHVPINKDNEHKNIINKRKRRGVEELMDKMDKEYEKYIMFNYNPEFNLNHPILMHEKYRQHYLQGIAEEERYLQLQGREERQRLLDSRHIGQELDPQGKDLDEDIRTYAHGPAMFGTTWSYNQWPTIRYNILAPGKSYNNTQYFYRYYQNQTVKNRIKAIFRDYFAKPFNASVPVKQFVEPERDTEEFESLAKKERRKRSLEISQNLGGGFENNLENANEMSSNVHINNNHRIRKKRHYIDKACFHERRERPDIGRKFERKCNCVNKDPLHQHHNQKEYQANFDNIKKIPDQKVNFDSSILNDKADEQIFGINMKKIRQRTAKPTTPKLPRTPRRKDDNDGAENVLLNVDAVQADQHAQPLTAHCGCHRRAVAHRNRRQIRVDVMNNNTIRKINWERLAKILVAENQNLSKLLDKHMTKRTTPERRYECKHCGDRFLSLQPYVEHIVHHEKEFELEQSYSEEFNITCDHCYQIFSTEDAIHEHNLERMRILKEREAEDYAKLNRTTRCKIYTPFEGPFTIPIMENEDNTWWNPEPITVTDDPAMDRYYCLYCKDMMSNTKEVVEHRKFHEVSRIEAKKAYLERKKKIDEKIRKEFSVEGEIHM